MNHCFRHLSALLLVLIGATFWADTTLRLLNQADDLLVTIGAIAAFLGIWLLVTSTRRIFSSWKNVRKS